jgi:UrcA family protein
MRSKIHMLLLSLVAVAGSSLAMADAPVVTVKTETVKYDDIRLISAVGAAVLYGRLNGAAERACGGPIETVPLQQRVRFKQCVDEAVELVLDGAIRHAVMLTPASAAGEA